MTARSKCEACRLLNDGYRPAKDTEAGKGIQQTETSPALLLVVAVRGSKRGGGLTEDENMRWVERAN